MVFTDAPQRWIAAQGEGDRSGILSECGAADIFICIVLIYFYPLNEFYG